MLFVELGELQVYDPVTNTGKFTLPMYAQNTSSQTPPPVGEGQPIETAFIPIGTVFTGPACGMQFQPVQGAQALILFLEGLQMPIAAIFLATDVETPPFPKGDASGWIDQSQSAIKTTVDGQNVGDKKGGARIIGSGYASVVAPLLELGAEGLNAGDNAVVRRKDVVAMLSSLAQQITQWAAANVQAGSGAPPISLSGVQVAGSSVVKAAD